MGEEPRDRAESGHGTAGIRPTGRGMDDAEVDRLLPRVYEELRRLARVVLDAERPGHTLQTTALVHEVYLKLSAQRTVGWRTHAEFMAIAAQAMRRILVDHARGRQAAKRGGGAVQVPLDGALELSKATMEGLPAIDDALERLGVVDAAMAKVVSMKFFGGMTTEQIAEVLGVATRTVERDWATARAWLRADLTRTDR